MSDQYTPGQDVSFTITKRPNRPAQVKTIQRLMRMQPSIQSGLKKLATKRRRFDNRPYIRAGVEWVARVRTTKLTRVEPGETFTLRISPQIVPDLKSVDKFLDAKSA